jgi:microcystin-dependent protein
MKRDSRLYSRHLYKHGEGTEQNRWAIPPAPDGCRSYIITLPEDGDYLAQVIGALGILADSEHYTCDADRDAAAQAYQQAILSLTGWHGMVSLQQPGDIKIGAGTQTESWLLCDGGEYPIATYEALYSAIGDAFGETASGWFKVPDLRDKFILGAGGDASTGDTGGESEHTLTVDEIPAHTHTYTAATLSAGLIGEIPASVAEPNPFSNTGSTGGGEAHNNMPPYLALGAWIFTGIPDCVTCDPPPIPEPPPAGMELIYELSSPHSGDLTVPITTPGDYRIEFTAVSSVIGTGHNELFLTMVGGDVSAWREAYTGFASVSFFSSENPSTTEILRHMWLPQTPASPGPITQYQANIDLKITEISAFTRLNGMSLHSGAASTQRFGTVMASTMALYTRIQSGMRFFSTNEISEFSSMRIWKQPEP